MEKLTVLTFICSTLQIVGFLCIILREMVKAHYQTAINVLIGISGFAGIVSYFIVPTSIISIVAAIAGLGYIIVSIIPKKETITLIISND